MNIFLPKYTLKFKFKIPRVQFSFVFLPSRRCLWWPAPTTRHFYFISSMILPLVAAAPPRKFVKWRNHDITTRTMSMCIHCYSMIISATILSIFVIVLKFYIKRCISHRTFVLSTEMDLKISWWNNRNKIIKMVFVFYVSKPQKHELSIKIGNKSDDLFLRNQMWNVMNGSDTNIGSRKFI